MGNKKLLGKRIKELRKSANLTQEKLAELIGIETTSLSGIESGRHFPSLMTLEKIADNLKIELKAFFDFNHLQTIDKIKSDIKESIESLEEDKIRTIHKLISK